MMGEVGRGIRIQKIHNHKKLIFFIKVTLTQTQKGVSVQSLTRQYHTCLPSLVTDCFTVSQKHRLTSKVTTSLPFSSLPFKMQPQTASFSSSFLPFIWMELPRAYTFVPSLVLLSMYIHARAVACCYIVTFFPFLCSNPLFVYNSFSTSLLGCFNFEAFIQSCCS